jgi:hypothetical protein
VDVGGSLAERKAVDMQAPMQAVSSSFKDNVWQVHYHKHRHLEDLAWKLKDTLSTRDSDLIFMRAQHFYSELIKHMQEEEAPGGIYSQISNKSPEHEPMVRKLKAQHVEILETLRAICTEVDENLKAVVLFMDDCLALVARHEKDEENLLNEVLIPN